MAMKTIGIRAAKARWRLEDSGLIEPVYRHVRELPPPLPLEIDLAQEWLEEDSSAW